MAEGVAGAVPDQLISLMGATCAVSTSGLPTRALRPLLPNVSNKRLREIDDGNKFHCWTDWIKIRSDSSL